MSKEKVRLSLLVLLYLCACVAPAVFTGCERFWSVKETRSPGTRDPELVEKLRSQGCSILGESKGDRVTWLKLGNVKSDHIAIVSEFFGLKNLDIRGHVDAAGEPMLDDNALSVLNQPELFHLRISDVGEFDACTSRFASFPKLVWLELDGQFITDNAVRSLSGMKQLEQLELLSVDLGPKGIELLGNARQLEFLRLRDTNVTAEQYRAIRTALPDTKIDYRPRSGIE